MDTVPDSAPLWPLRAAATLAVLAVFAAGLARWLGVATPSATSAPVRLERQLRFVERAGGGIDVIDARAGVRIDELRPGADGFIRATLRGLARERRRRGLGPEVPFRLALHEDNRLTLEDPATGRLVELEAFGPSNSGAFARLLPSRERASPRPT